MKQKKILSFYVFLLISIMACNEQRSVMTKNNILDSVFKYNYTILDSIAKGNPLDTSAVCKNAIELMEKITGIKASKDGNYFGVILFTRKDLEKWKEWYNKNNNE